MSDLTTILLEAIILGLTLGTDACPTGALRFGTKTRRGIRTHNLVKFVLLSITMFFVITYLLVSFLG